MEERTEDKNVLQWHQAFYAGLQIELEDEADRLIFESEHQLGTKPKEIDVLIIRKDSEDPIRKNIGQIFRKYNIVEYKSPTDYLSVDDFYKVYAYGCFYKSDSPKVDAIRAEELTLTFVCHGYPRSVMKHLQKIRRYRIQRMGNGIYWVYGDFIPIQFIVTTQLSTEENLWLRSLTNSLKGKREVDELLDSYNMHHKNVLYESVMDIIVRANQEAFEEVSGMCKALEELMHDTIEERVEERIEERIEERTKRYERLNLLLAQSNRVADIVKAAEDKEYRQQLMEELGL